MSEPRWYRSESTLWRRTVAGVVLLPDRATNPVQLAGAAALVWDVLEEPSTSAEAAELLAGACAEDPARIRADVERLLTHLNDLGAVMVEDASPC